jgi:UDP-N-acetylglucosamine acyltransferase
MISPLAHIHPKAKIGKEVTIEAFSSISGDVEIGDGTWIGPNVTVFDGARIGKSCRIFPGAVVSAIPQDLKFAGEVTTAEVGDFTTIREAVTINRGTKAANRTVVGSHCLLMAYVHVAHDCFVGNHVILANNVALSGHIIIEDFAILEGMVGVQQFIRIGAHSFIGGFSQVRKDVPPFVKAAREPLSYVGINAVGLRRRNFSPEQILEIQEIYRMVYQKNLNVSQAVSLIEASRPETAERHQILTFIKNASQGIMRGINPDE